MSWVLHEDPSRYPVLARKQILRNGADEHSCGSVLQRAFIELP